VEVGELIVLGAASADSVDLTSISGLVLVGAGSARALGISVDEPCVGAIVAVTLMAMGVDPPETDGTQLTRPRKKSIRRIGGCNFISGRLYIGNPQIAENSGMLDV